MSIEVTVLAAIAGLSSKVTIDAIYYLLRLVRHRGILNEKVDTLIVRGLSNEPSREAEALAVELIRKIEGAEHRKISDLNDSEVDELVTIMERVVTKKYEGGIKLDESRGRQILEEMRSTDANYMHNKSSKGTP